MSTDVLWFSSTPQECWQEKSAEVSAKGEAGLQVSNEKHQTWEGFGGCFNELGWIALSGASEDVRRQVMESLFGSEGCRFTRCRVPIGASDYGAEWYSHNETDGDFAMEHFSIERDRKYLLPYIKAAQAVQPDLDLFASPWSPPTWFKFPKAYNYGTMIWQPEYLDAYALYFLKFVQAYRAEGVPVVQVHVQNEPVADQKFPSCVWTGAQLRDFIRDHLGPLFAEHNEPCEIWLGTLNTDDYNQYVHLPLSDERARNYISGVGFQWAGKGAIQQADASWPGMRLLQTENECGDGTNTWDYALYIFDLFRHYIANGVNGYTYWNMILQPGGSSTWGWLQNSMITADPATGEVTYNPEFFVMKHYARFVEPGSVRLGLAGQWTGNATAFETPDGRIVLIVANPFDDARELTFEAAGEQTSARLEAKSFNTFVIK